MTHEKLKESIAQLPKTPGVYIFRDAKRKPVYIGKATNLKSRVSAYPKSSDIRIRKMIEHAASLDHQETGTDIEALILESQLIKQHLPQFNIVMRDDKQYFFVGFTNEDFPKVFITHQPTKESREKRIEYKALSPNHYSLDPNFIGPFTEGTPLRATLRVLRNIFPYCTCKQKHHVRCLNAHIGKCIGDCCLKDPELGAQKKYRKNISAIADILQGKRTSLLKKMEKEMKALAATAEFEKAQDLQRKIASIQRVFDNVGVLQDLSNQRAQSVLAGAGQLQEILKLTSDIHRIEGYDISNIQGEHATGAMVVFEDGVADKNSYRKFKIKTVNGSDDIAMLREVLQRRFNHPEWELPDLIIVDGGKGQINAILSVLKNYKLKAISSIPVIGLTKDQRHVGDHIFMGAAQGLVKTPKPLSALPEGARNLILAVDAEAHRFAISYYRKLHGRALKK